MRISSAVLPLLPLTLLAGCGDQKADQATLATVEAQQRADSEAKGEIECTGHDTTAFARVCTVDREQRQDGLVLTLRHPDGAFRRLLVTSDGRGVIAADGAEKAVVTILGRDRIEVALGGARYRLPATVRGAAAPAP